MTKIFSSKMARQPKTISHPDSSPAQNVASISPPDYGINFVDNVSTMSEVTMPIQRKTPGDEEELMQGKFMIGQADGIQTKSEKVENKTGIPDNLKAGLENLSGRSMDDVRIHYNSSKPADINAHAFTQGKHIHIAPGQQRHLPHEGWHAVQQKQGRVNSTIQMVGYPVNDDPSLEKEADKMGGAAVQISEDTVISNGTKRRGTLKPENTESYHAHLNSGSTVMHMKGKTHEMCIESQQLGEPIGSKGRADDKGRHRNNPGVFEENGAIKESLGMVRNNNNLVCKNVGQGVVQRNGKKWHQVQIGDTGEIKRYEYTGENEASLTLQDYVEHEGRAYPEMVEEHEKRIYSEYAITARYTLPAGSTIYHISKAKHETLLEKGIEPSTEPTKAVGQGYTLSALTSVGHAYFIIDVNQARALRRLIEGVTYEFKTKGTIHCYPDPEFPQALRTDETIAVKDP